MSTWRSRSPNLRALLAGGALFWLEQFFFQQDALPPRLDQLLWFVALLLPGVLVAILAQRSPIIHGVLLGIFVSFLGLSGLFLQSIHGLLPFPFLLAIAAGYYVLPCLLGAVLGVLLRRFRHPSGVASNNRSRGP